MTDETYLGFPPLSRRVIKANVASRRKGAISEATAKELWSKDEIDDAKARAEETSKLMGWGRESG